MSTDPNGHVRNEDGDRESTTWTVAEEDTDGTPKSEIPISVKVSTPSTVMDETARQADYGAADGYFTSHPAATEQHAYPVEPADTTDTIPEYKSQSDPQLTVPSSLGAAERPRPYSATSSWSIQSADSAATVKAAATSAPVLPTPQPRPEFPNQSYAALQYQRHPTPHHPPTLRTRSSHPGQILTFTSAVASLHQSRPVGNSAPVTPGIGLFQPHHVSSEWEPAVTPGTYASPFLHFTQRVPPKETHVADVDVDPISGRKLINHYEIIDELGRGTHGKVKLGRDLNSPEENFVAIKIVERFSKRRKLGKLGTTEDKVKKEVAILKQVRHPNVTALLEVIDDPSRKKVYIVLEWVELGQISWRVKGPKEITLVEARRYEHEKKGRNDFQSEAEEVAIFAEAQKRLSRQRRRQMRTFRRVRRDAPGAWSMELVGDDDSDNSDDDQLSRISTESYSSKLLRADGHSASRTPSPLPPLPQDAAETITDYQSVTSEPQTVSPTASKSIWTGLEGTMYGAYVPSIPSSENHSRVASIRSFGAKSRSKASTESLSHMAAEILDSELNDELEYVPSMTIHQARVAFRDTVLGLQYLHFQGIIHRDIKPPNLLSTKEHRVKISDFGVSYLGRPMAENDAGEGVGEHETRDLVDDNAKELAKTVGTPAFYAPELCITEAVDDPPPITKAIDVWALGVTLFCMLFARTPFVDNEFVVMRQIVEEEIYLPRKRLRPVEPKPRSRPSSHGRGFPPMPSGFRHELELSYEEIDDDLHDLLRRMLVKDPRKRITLEEVRHHPWLVADIQDKVQWLEETDPSRQSQGKKIEVSKEDVNAAVVPLQFLDRVRSGIRKVGERLGLGGKPSGRSRTHSNAGGESSPAPSDASSGTNRSQDGFRRSLHGDEAIFSALKASRDGEHPLSRSVSTSPEEERHDPYTNYIEPRPQSASAESVRAEVNLPRLTSVGPAGPAATSASMRTVRQSDFQRGRGEESPPPSPGMPGTPTMLESPNRLSGGWTGGVARRILQTVRERSSARSSDGRASSRGSLASIDTHGEPSLAVSQTTAAGRVDGFDDFTPGSVTSSPRGSPRGSPSASRPLSAVSSPSADRLFLPNETGFLSRTSSGGSVSSLGRRAVLHQSNMNRHSYKAPGRVPPESSAEDWQRAEEEHIRKLIREGEQDHETQSSFDDRVCPPSPDDQRERESDSRRMSELDISNFPSSLETSPTGQGLQFPGGIASSTSDLGSAVSISISDPSIPSAISEASSVDSTDGEQPRDDVPKTDLMSSDDTVNGGSELRHENHDAVFPPNQDENKPESDGEDFYDSSDSDGGLVMNSRRRSAAKPAPSVRSGSKAGAKRRRGSAVSKKTSRSGSSNTMMQARSQDGEERREQS